MKRVLHVLLVVLFASSSFAADVWPGRNHWTDKRWGNTIADIENHYYPEGRLKFMHPASTYRNYGDPTNWAHELTHAVAALLRNTAGTSDSHAAVYCLNDAAYTFRTPKCRLVDVRNRLKWKGKNYQLYFETMMQHWSNQPLYPLDELQAYTNGTIATLELYGTSHDAKYSFECVKEFNYYARVALETVKELDPNYPDMAKLEEYIAYNTEVMRGLERRFTPEPPDGPGTDYHIFLRR